MSVATRSDVTDQLALSRRRSIGVADFVRTRLWHLTRDPGGIVIGQGEAARLCWKPGAERSFLRPPSLRGHIFRLQTGGAHGLVENTRRLSHAERSGFISTPASGIHRSHGLHVGSGGHDAHVDCSIRSADMATPRDLVAAGFGGRLVLARQSRAA